MDTLEGKPTVCTRRKAAILETHGKSIRIPPGSVGRACIQGGSSGTWESQLFPYSGIRF